jgi:hypothetical protein
MNQNRKESHNSNPFFPQVAALILASTASLLFETAF